MGGFTNWGRIGASADRSISRRRHLILRSPRLNHSPSELLRSLFFFFSFFSGILSSPLLLLSLLLELLEMLLGSEPSGLPFLRFFLLPSLVPFLLFSTAFSFFFSFPVWLPFGTSSSGPALGVGGGGGGSGGGGGGVGVRRGESGGPSGLELEVLIVAFAVYRSFLNSSNLFSDH